MGSIRENRLGEKVANNVMEVLEKRDDADYELVDLKDFPLPLYDQPVPTSAMQEPYIDPVMAKWQKTIEDADGYIFITAEYNRSIPSALKNAIDYVYYEWNKKPMAVVSYGNAAGGSRAAEHLRSMAIELQMAPVRIGVHIPFVWEKFDESGKLVDFDRYANTINDMSDQLNWWTKALKTAREE